MRNTVDLNNIDAIQSIDGLCEAIKATFDPNLNISSAAVFRARMQIKAVAIRLGCVQEVQGLIDSYTHDFPGDNYTSRIMRLCECDRRGNPLNIADNYKIIMANDPYYAGIKQNAMSLRPETSDENGKIRPWTDVDDANSRAYIEKTYGLYSRQKHDDSLADLFDSRRYHPIKDVISALKWDGESRIPMLLTKWMGAEDTPYTREVSRLIFAGGIHRLYRPGCKFEDMPVLVGGQGAGKSSFVRFLAIEDRFYSELNTIEGKESIEAIEGSWIVEVSELLALTKTKEQEAVKAYLSRQFDKYRPAYGRRVVERQRSCAFIGTTNREQFITDKTGGRRFYPIKCSNTGYNLFDHEQECREYIRQCWAEAYAKMDTPFMAPFADRALKPQMEDKQQDATEEDVRVGLIEAYLDSLDGDFVCTGMLWEIALGNSYKQPEKADQTQIGLIMQNMPGWVRANDNKRNFGRFGRQRYWRRVRIINSEAVTYNTPNDEVPF